MTTKSKMTPGPWNIQSPFNPSDPDDGFRIFGDECELAIAWNTSFEKTCSNTPLPAEDNAKAIAAVPDLIEAAQSALTCLEDHKDDYPATFRTLVNALKKAGVE